VQLFRNNGTSPRAAEPHAMLELSHRGSDKIRRCRRCSLLATCRRRNQGNTARRKSKTIWPLSSSFGLHFLAASLIRSHANTLGYRKLGVK
jgi:hypothetical protein